MESVACCCPVNPMPSNDQNKIVATNFHCLFPRHQRRSNRFTDDLISIMLTTHRNQENLVPTHQGNAKQQPKTPGARFPKTPSKFGHNDENATTIFPGKSVLKDVKTTRQVLVTPSGTLANVQVQTLTTTNKLLLQRPEPEPRLETKPPTPKREQTMSLEEKTQ